MRLRIGGWCRSPFPGDATGSNRIIWFWHVERCMFVSLSLGHLPFGFWLSHCVAFIFNSALCQSATAFFRFSFRSPLATSMFVRSLHRPNNALHFAHTPCTGSMGFRFRTFQVSFEARRLNRSLQTPTAQNGVESSWFGDHLTWNELNQPAPLIDPE